MIISVLYLGGNCIHTSTFTSLKSDHKYQSLKKLYQFHQERMYYDNLFNMMLPKSLYLAFHKHYSIKNAHLFKQVIGILKVIIFGLIFFLIFSWANFISLQTLMFLHLFFLWVYISSQAYQIYTKNSLHKNDMLMLMIGKYRKQLFMDEIKEKFSRSYFTSLMQLTLISVIILSIMDGSSRSILSIFGFILFQVIGYIISKFVVMNLFKLKYIKLRHSFFKDFLMSILLTLISAAVYLLFLYPMFFINSDFNILILYPVLTLYAIVITWIGTIWFSSWIVKFVDRHIQAILYPKAISSRENIKAKFFHVDSLVLKGLDGVEKAIVIKDQKMFKRSNRKEYFGSYFYGIVLIFSGLPYASRINDIEDILGTVALSMLFSGMAFTIHMVETALISKHISYSSEGSLVLTYQRLSIPTQKIFNAKLRLFYYMLLPIIVLYVLSYGAVFIQFSIDKLWIFFFGILYFTGLSRVKLRNFIHLDTQNTKAYLNTYQMQASTMGSSLVIGLFFIIIIPLGFTWIGDQVIDAFGIKFLYGMMITIVLVIWLINIIQDIHIRKIQKGVLL